MTFRNCREPLEFGMMVPQTSSVVDQDNTQRDSETLSYMAAVALDQPRRDNN